MPKKIKKHKIILLLIILGILIASILVYYRFSFTDQDCVPWDQKHLPGIENEKSYLP